MYFAWDSDKSQELSQNLVTKHQLFIWRVMKIHIFSVIVKYNFYKYMAFI